MTDRMKGYIVRRIKVLQGEGKSTFDICQQLAACATWNKVRKLIDEAVDGEKG